MEIRRPAVVAALALAGALASAGAAHAQAACSHYAAPFAPEGGRPAPGEPAATRGGAGTLEQPFTVADFWERGLAKPGSVLCLKDGLYRGDRSMIHPDRDLAISGRADARVEVRALHDGAVWIDGELERTPVRVTHDHWTVAGIDAFDGPGRVVAVAAARSTEPEAGDRRPVQGVVLRRIVAWRDFVPSGSSADYENAGGEAHVFDLSDARDLLVEDCAGFGWARRIFQVKRSQRVTLRRSWARWDGRYPYTRRNKLAFGCSSRAYDTLCENLIATAGGSRDEGAAPASYAPDIHLIAAEGSGDGLPWAGPAGRDVNDLGLRVLASLAYLPDDPRFDRVAGIHVGGSGFPDKGLKGVRIADSVVRVPGRDLRALQLRDCADDPEASPEACSWQRGASRDAAPLVVERVTVAGAGAEPASIGADWRRTGVRVVGRDARIDLYRGREGGALCHRTENGVTSREPLWPWPMQARILAATERSRWPTADVGAEIAALFGPPPPECTR